MENKMDTEFDFSKVPSSKTIAPEILSENINAGTIDENMLSEDDRLRVSKIVEELDVSDVEQVINYGQSAQKSISDFSSSVLNKVKTLDLGEIGSALKDLTLALDETVKPPKKGIFALIHKAKKNIDSIRANYVKAETNVNKIEMDLRTHQDILYKDIMMFQQMYETNYTYYKELTLYIIAGKKALNKIRSEKLKQLEEKAAITQSQDDIQKYRDFSDLCNRFDKKLSDLELTRLIAIQTAPQIRLLQNNDREMLDKIQSSLSNTIPLWRNQFVLSLGIAHTQYAIEAQQILSSKTNELLAKNAETLKMATIGAAEESEKSIVDIGVLEKCNKELISSINEMVRIHKDGSEQRVIIREKLITLENELKQSLLDNMK